MPNFLSRYATPFITGLFLVSLISGIALFFHWQPSAFREMHEWLSLVLVLPFVFHIWKNWRPMTVYFSKPAFTVAMVLSLAASLAFAWPALTGAGNTAGGPPPFAFARKVMDGKAADLAPVLNLTADALVEKLKTAGFTAASAEKSLKEIAGGSGKDEMEIFATLSR